MNAKTASAKLGQQAAEHHPEGSAGGCPVCKFLNRDHTSSWS